MFTQNHALSSNVRQSNLKARKFISSQFCQFRPKMCNSVQFFKLWKEYYWFIRIQFPSIEFFFTSERMSGIYSASPGICTCLTRTRIKVSDLHNNISIALLYVIASSCNVCRLWWMYEPVRALSRKGKESGVCRGRRLNLNVRCCHNKTHDIPTSQYDRQEEEQRTKTRDNLAKDGYKNLWRCRPLQWHPSMTQFVTEKEGGKIREKEKKCSKNVKRTNNKNGKIKCK